MAGGKDKLAQLPRIGDQPTHDALEKIKPKKASLNKKVESLIEHHPDRALKVVRQWMDEDRDKNGPDPDSI